MKERRGEERKKSVLQLARPDSLLLLRSSLSSSFLLSSCDAISLDNISVLSQEESDFSLLLKTFWIQRRRTVDLF